MPVTKPCGNHTATNRNTHRTAAGQHYITLSLGDGRGRPPIAAGRFLEIIETLNSRRIAPTLDDLRTFAPDINWTNYQTRVSALRKAGLIDYVPSPSAPFRNAFVVAPYFPDFKIATGPEHAAAVRKLRSMVQRCRVALANQHKPSKRKAVA